MRKHSPRKWLHAVLDLLPLIIIPIFAIYSHRHTIDNYAIEVPQNEIVEVKQLAVNGKPYNTDYYSVDTDAGTGGSITFLNNSIYFTESNGFDLYAFYEYEVTFLSQHKYLVSFDTKAQVYDIDDDFNNNWSFDCYSMNDYFIVFEGVNLTEDFSRNQHIITNLDEERQEGFYFYVNVYNGSMNFILKNFQVFDLTTMFGSGNEPTIPEFNSYFSKEYYDTNSTAKALVKNVGTITYNDTDIGSQFVYALYRPIDKYFNLSQVGVFGQLYDFLQVNMFNGNAPISIFIVYHVILYEFIMDLIFLIYCVFMFIIDFAEKMLDSFFDMSFGGGKR